MTQGAEKKDRECILTHTAELEAAVDKLEIVLKQRFDRSGPDKSEGPVAGQVPHPSNILDEIDQSVISATKRIEDTIAFLQKNVFSKLE